MELDEAVIKLSDEEVHLTKRQKVKFEELKKEWDYLVSQLKRSWGKGMVSFVDSDANAVFAFLYNNRKWLSSIGVLTNERYDAIHDLLDLMVRFVWDPEGEFSEDPDLFPNEADAIRTRFNQKRLIS